MQLNNLHSIFIPKLPIYFQASAGISSVPTAFPHVIPLSAVSVSSSLMFRVIAWLGSLSYVSTLWFSLFISMLKYWPHRSLLSSSFIKTSPVALLTLRIWHNCCPCPIGPLQLQFDRSLAVLQQFPVEYWTASVSRLSIACFYFFIFIITLLSGKVWR